MSEVGVSPLFGDGRDADRQSAASAVELGLMTLYPVELYPEDSADAAIADDINMAVTYYLSVPSNEVDVRALRIFDLDRAREVFRYVVDRAMDTQPPEAMEHLFRLQRLVGAEFEDEYAGPTVVADVVPLPHAE